MLSLCGSHMGDAELYSGREGGLRSGAPTPPPPTQVVFIYWCQQQWQLLRNWSITWNLVRRGLLPAAVSIGGRHTSRANRLLARRRGGVRWAQRRRWRCWGGRTRGLRPRTGRYLSLQWLACCQASISRVRGRQAGASRLRHHLSVLKDITVAKK